MLFLMYRWFGLASSSRSAFPLLLSLQKQRNPMLGNYLKALRLSKRLTLLDVANQLAVSRAFIHQVEGDYVRPSQERLQQLAEFLGADAEYLSLLTGRVPPDVLAALRANPALLSRIRSNHSAV
jgi:transcriptional regulator with XRE-family HTH domain